MTDDAFVAGRSQTDGGTCALGLRLYEDVAEAANAVKLARGDSAGNPSSETAKGIASSEVPCERPPWADTADAEHLQIRNWMIHGLKTRWR